MPSDIIGKLLQQSKSVRIQHTKQNDDPSAVTAKKKVIHKQDEKKEKEEKPSDAFSFLFQAAAPKAPVPISQHENTQKTQAKNEEVKHIPENHAEPICDQKSVTPSGKANNIHPVIQQGKVDAQKFNALFLQHSKTPLPDTLTGKHPVLLVNDNNQLIKTPKTPFQISKKFLTNEMSFAPGQNSAEKKVLMPSRKEESVIIKPKESSNKPACDFIVKQNQYRETKEDTGKKAMPKVPSHVLPDSKEKEDNKSIALNDELQLSARYPAQSHQDTVETFSSTVPHIPKIIIHQNGQDKKNIVIHLEPKNLGSIRVIIQNHSKTPTISIQVQKNEGFVQIQSLRDNMLKDIHAKMPDAMLKIFLNEEDADVFSDVSNSKIAKKMTSKKK